MSGEYSRDLSTKVFAGPCRLIELGFRQGGTAGFGLRRRLIDGTGSVKGNLARGEHKSIQTDRVIPTLGPHEGVETVRWIYRSFVEGRRSEADIAKELNARPIQAETGNPWSRGTVHQVLINPKYAGDNVWNRRSAKLKETSQSNAPELWVRLDSAFDACVDHALFDAAQAIVIARSTRLSKAEMLEALRCLLATEGKLCGLIIDEAEGLPSSSVYQSRFKSLLRAYALIGYTPERDYSYVEINRALWAMRTDIVEKAIAGIEAAVGAAAFSKETGVLTMNGEFTVSIVLASSQETSAASRRWTIRLDDAHRPDLTIAVRLDSRNVSILDFYLLPRRVALLFRMRLSGANGVFLDAFRFDTLDTLFEMTGRVDVLEVAHQHPTAYRMIPINRIDIVNPPVRSRRVFLELVESIATVGLKRPVTVASRQTPTGPRYDLVCGQGRLDRGRKVQQYSTAPRRALSVTTLVRTYRLKLEGSQERPKLQCSVKSYRFGSQRLAMRQATVKAGLKTLPTS